MLVQGYDLGVAHHGGFAGYARVPADWVVPLPDQLGCREAAALGVPVLTGPYNFNGKDIARLMLDQGAALQVHDAQELAAVLARLLADPQDRRRIGAIGRHIVQMNRGSVARLLELIEPLLSAPVPPDSVPPGPPPAAAVNRGAGR